ncbi:MAG: tetratricopeptide repeat protein, partial [Lentisphaeria bacterium]
GIIPIGAQAQADRYSYLPQIGLLLLGVWSGRALLARWAEPVRARLWGGAAVATATVVLAAMTWVQAGFWRDSVALFASAVDAWPGNYMARYALGISLVEADRPADAEPHLAAAAAIAPQFPGHFYALAVSLSRQGRHAEAVRECRRVLLMTPEDAKAQQLLGMELYRTGRRQEAVQALKAAVRLRPEVAEPALILAWWLATDPDPARRDGAAAVRLARTVCESPEGRASPSAWNTLGAALAEGGRFPEAVAAMREAIRLARDAGINPDKKLAERLAAYERGQPWRE